MPKETTPYSKLFIPIRSPEEGGGQVLAFESPEEMMGFADQLYSAKAKSKDWGECSAYLHKRFSRSDNYIVIQGYLQSSGKFDDFIRRFYDGLEISRNRMEREYNEWLQAHSRSHQRLREIMNRS